MWTSSIKYGQVKRGVLGVNIYPVTPDIAKEFGVAESSGALVAGVVPGSAAEHAGVKTGDIITSINGVTMKDAGELKNTIGMLRIGDKVEIGLLRDGKSRKVMALIAERSEVETANAIDINKGLEGAEFGDAPDGGGVVVRTVLDGSPAAQNGLRANDVIVGVARTPVTNTKSFREAAKNANVLVLNVRARFGRAAGSRFADVLARKPHRRSGRHRIFGDSIGRATDQRRSSSDGVVAGIGSSTSTSWCCRDSPLKIATCTRKRN